MNTPETNGSLPQLIEEPVKEKQKKAYHTPIISKYGSLSELTQLRPSFGRDGSPWADCTRS